MAQSDIMIVDDNPVNLKLLEDMLQRQDHAVRSFPLGRLALVAALRKSPDLILLDIDMPEMDGYEVCKRLKSVKHLSEIPVIFLSALNETSDKVKAFQSGAADYISKPFQLEEVHARVQTHLNLHRLQQVLRRRNERLEESAADIIFRLELYPQPRVAYINPAATSIVGYSPEEHYADPGLFLRIIHPDDRGLIEPLFLGSASSDSTVTLRCVHRNGNQIWLEQHNRLVHDPDGRPIAIEGIARDITERKHLQEQLHQSQKMEAIGLLVGGVAHDFNNLLNVIIGYSDLILSNDQPAAPIVEKIAEVRKAGNSAAALVQQLLAFGRRQVVQATVLAIDKVVESSSNMLRRIIGNNIEFVTASDAGLGSIRADAGQIEQILMNLVVNAKGAMPQGGRITIETQNILVDKTSPGVTLAGGSGPFVMLAVSDTGCGMDASTQARMFEPFYTTKEPGKGTGLGLSIVQGIVEQNKGNIRVVSSPGHGARFEILFPRIEMPEESPHLTAMPSELPIGGETILVVEDDADVRELIAAMLKAKGFELLIASDGNEALRICKWHKGEVGLILADLLMPGMSEPALIEKIGLLNPGMRILCMSGYGGDAEGAHVQLLRGIPLIRKPFTAVKLVEMIRETLDQGIAANGTTKSKC
jgi:two-component system, cell cycle sensor histidine kinase and response regulator CckA